MIEAVYLADFYYLVQSKKNLCSNLTAPNVKCLLWTSPSLWATHTSYIRSQVGSDVCGACGCARAPRRAADRPDRRRRRHARTESSWTCAIDVDDERRQRAMPWMPTPSTTLHARRRRRRARASASSRSWRRCARRSPPSPGTVPYAPLAQSSCLRAPFLAPVKQLPWSC